MITPSELEALELLVKAGKVDHNAPWVLAVRQAGDYIIKLAEQITSERVQTTIPAQNDN